MPSLNDIVTISITTTAASVSRAGFGRPLIVGPSNRFSDANTRLYTSLTGVAADFLTTDPEYMAAAQIFAQSPCPVDLKIGRRAHQSTQLWTVTPSAFNSTLYRITLDGVNADYTSGSSATVAAIVTGLKSAIDALAPSAWSNNHVYIVGDKVLNDTNRIYECITGGTSAGSGGPTGTNQDITDNTCHWKYNTTKLNTTDSTTFLGVADPRAGEWHRLVINDVNLMQLVETTSDAGVASDLNAIVLTDNDWYGFMLCGQSVAEVTAAAGWSESNTKLFFTATADSAVISSATTDIAYLLKGLSYKRTSTWFHRDPGQFIEAAIMGSKLCLDAGTETWAFALLSGVTADTLTAAQQNYATGTASNSYTDGKACNIYVTVSGRAMTWPGLVCDLEFIDKIRGCDWYGSDMQANVFALFASASSAGSKIPFDDSGISSILAQMQKTNVEAVRRGFLVSNPGPTVTAPKASEVSSANKQARKLPSVVATGTIAGAIHLVSIAVKFSY